MCNGWRKLVFVSGRVVKLLSLASSPERAAKRLWKRVRSWVGLIAIFQLQIVYGRIRHIGLIDPMVGDPMWTIARGVGGGLVRQVGHNPLNECHLCSVESR